MSEVVSVPQYIDEKRVSEITGMSRIWLQRARSEGIGPRFYKIGRRVVYRLDDVMRWIESGQAGKEHLRTNKANKASKAVAK
jgi:predicted DNA-binding transcriptional regulator AlpA